MTCVIDDRRGSSIIESNGRSIYASPMTRRRSLILVCVTHNVYYYCIIVCGCIIDGKPCVLCVVNYYYCALLLKRTENTERGKK